jgi:hypothetical protein
MVTLMDGQWLTYRDLAVRLGVSVEAARRRALRGKWARMPSNKGVTLVMPPDDLSDRCAPDVRLTSAPDVRPDTSALVTALESHIKTLLGDNETLKERLAAATAQAERLGADFATRDARHAGELAGEREKVEVERARANQAIAEFSELADALARIAVERARPWWRRLTG